MAVSDMDTLQPESPLEGEWDYEPGKGVSEGIVEGRTRDGSSEVAAARAEALNNALRPLDRYMSHFFFFFPFYVP